MSPRIQVYTTVACRALHRKQPPGLNLQSLTSSALDCSGTDVPARAAKIQACAYIHGFPVRRLKHINSYHNPYEHLECNHDRFLESPRRCPRTQASSSVISRRCPCYVPPCLSASLRTSLTPVTGNFFTFL